MALFPSERNIPAAKIQKKTRQRLWAVAIFVWTLVIWGHSLLPAPQSSVESGHVLVVVKPFLRLMGLTPKLWHTAVRKCAHMTEFAILSSLWYGMIESRTTQFSNKLITVGFACMVTALLDETIQLFRPGRSGQISDVWVDLCGVAIGIIVATVWRKLHSRTKE